MKNTVFSSFFLIFSIDNAHEKSFIFTILEMILISILGRIWSHFYEIFVRLKYAENENFIFRV